MSMSTYDISSLASAAWFEFKAKNKTEAEAEAKPKPKPKSKLNAKFKPRGKPKLKSKLNAKSKPRGEDLDHLRLSTKEIIYLDKFLTQNDVNVKEVVEVAKWMPKAVIQIKNGIKVDEMVDEDLTLSWFAAARSDFRRGEEEGYALWEEFDQQIIPLITRAVLTMPQAQWEQQLSEEEIFYNYIDTILKESQRRT